MKIFRLQVICVCSLCLHTACGGGAATPPPAPLVITSSAPPAGTTQTAYGASGSGFLLAASGGKTPYVWRWAAAAGSSLPVGLSVSNGSISGTPTTAGSSNVIVTVTDSESPAVQKSANYNIVINISALNITSSAAPAGTVQSAYGANGNGFLLTASGGKTPYTWNWAAAPGSSLPGGLTVANSSISGTPTTAGSYNVILSVTDSESPSVASSANYNIVISPPIAIASTAPPSGTVGLSYDRRTIPCRPNSPGCICNPITHTCLRFLFGFPLVAAGGTGPDAWSWAAAPGSSLPPGLKVVNNLIFGTPTTPGTYNVVVTVTDSSFPPVSISASYTITINLPPPPIIHTTLPPAGAVNLPYGFTFTASQGYAPLTWGETGALPAGLALGTGGVLSGTPTATGSFPIIVTAQDQFRQTGSQGFTIQIFAHGFKVTGSMGTPRVNHTATLLNSGMVLITGGTDNNGNALATAELFDPSSGIFSSTGSMASTRTNHTATLLASGQVLVAGGCNFLGSCFSGAQSSAELYDPATGSFAATGSLGTARGGHTATLLQNGKVLIAGGITVTAELYDPVSRTFSSTGDMGAIRSGHTATLLATGKVLVAGGTNSGGTLATAELFDPSAGTFSSTGSLTTARYAFTASLLPSGKVLIAGGNDGNGAVLATAEQFDPSVGTFALTSGGLVTGRDFHTSTLLVGGNVLISGGADTTGSATAAAELFDPSSSAFSGTGSLVAPRGLHAATRLNDGRVLLTGGFSGAGATASAELYQ